MSAFLMQWLVFQRLGSAHGDPITKDYKPDFHEKSTSQGGFRKADKNPKAPI
jgi:hypothetical protein